METLCSNKTRNDNTEKCLILMIIQFDQRWIYNIEICIRLYRKILCCSFCVLSMEDLVLFVLCSVNGRSCVVRSVLCQWKILYCSFCVLSMEDLVLFVLCSVNGRSCVVRSVNAATLIIYDCRKPVAKRIKKKA